MIKTAAIVIAVLLAIKFGFGKALGFWFKYLFYPAGLAAVGAFIGKCIGSDGAVIIFIIIGAIVGLVIAFRSAGKDLR